ncbi:MAG: ribosome biogenesis GTPase Der [Desulfuromonas sp.]|nr:MAG: ribosome biogenesis GTPase Der [Desulfuromonas sp.]
MTPVVAIVGRPNVGKSTLFNRLLGRRKALVEDIPGVTRDRNYARIDRYQKPFLLIDTGGFEPAATDSILSQMREQAQMAVEEADIILFVVDGQSGLNTADEEVAAMLRRVPKPVLLVANKVDGPKQEQVAAEFYALGHEELMMTSAAHGLGMGELVDWIEEHLPGSTDAVEEKEDLRLAVVGRPNVGKSSLINRLLGYQRVLASPVAGTTRDSIDSPLTYKDSRYLIIDTAGIRRKGKVSQVLEKYSVIQALKAMDRAHVVLLLIDASEGITEQDLTVAGYAFEKGRAIVLVVNKWDLVKKDHATMGSFVKDLRFHFKFLPEVPIVFVSAETGQRVDKIMAAVARVASQFNREIATATLNRVLQQAIEQHPPAMFHGKRTKYFYMTQTGVRPPTFTIFVSRSDGIHFSYQRYLTNQIAEGLQLKDVPIRLRFRQREH